MTRKDESSPRITSVTHVSPYGWVVCPHCRDIGPYTAHQSDYDLNITPLCLYETECCNAVISANDMVPCDVMYYQ